MAYKTNAINKKNPVIWAYSINLSLGLDQVTTSYIKNITCPPSKAGIGNAFIKARIIDKSAVVSQKSFQFHSAGNKLPIAAKPPN